LCIRTHIPNFSLQCLLKSSLDPVMIVHGLNFAWILFICGMQFSQNTVLCANSTIMWWCSCSNGKVFFIAPILSFMVMYLLNFWDMFVVVMPNIYIGFAFKLPVSKDVTNFLNPLLWYVLSTCCRDFIIVPLLLSFII